MKEEEEEELKSGDGFLDLVLRNINRRDDPLSSSIYLYIYLYTYIFIPYWEMTLISVYFLKRKLFTKYKKWKRTKKSFFFFGKHFGGGVELEVEDGGGRKRKEEEERRRKRRLLIEWYVAYISDSYPLFIRFWYNLLNGSFAKCSLLS